MTRTLADTVRRRSALAWIALNVLATLILTAGTATAHGVGSSQLNLRVEGPRIEGEWELNLRDARVAVGLDPNVTGEDGWNDLRAHEAGLRSVLLHNLRLTSNGDSCSIAIAPAPMVWEPEQGVVFFHLGTTCPSAPTRLGIRDELLFDQDSNHRGYFSVLDERMTNIGVFRTGLRSVTFDIHQLHRGAAFFEFLADGIAHVRGMDHLLVLLALLLPIVLLRGGGEWSPRAGISGPLRDAVKVVMAFALAHTSTLCLTFLGAVHPRAQWMEVAIGLSIFIAAWNNLRPFLPGPAWTRAIGFGLVHGLGFAGGLGSLSLPRHARGMAFGAFNLGVGLGELAMVALLVPLLYAASKRQWYPRFVMGAGSLGIAWLAVLWMIQRAFGLSLLPWF